MAHTPNVATASYTSNTPRKILWLVYKYLGLFSWSQKEPRSYCRSHGCNRVVFVLNKAECESTQHLRFLAPATIPSMCYGTRKLRYWVLGPAWQLPSAVEARKLEHDLPPTLSQRRKQYQHKSSCIHAPVFLRPAASCLIGSKRWSNGRLLSEGLLERQPYLKPVQTQRELS